MISFGRLTKWVSGSIHWLRTGRQVPSGLGGTIKEVFLIDKISEALLCHLALKENLRLRADPTAVQFAGRLSAITKLSASRFGESAESFGQITVESVSVCIEWGEHVFVAGVVEGKPPEWFRPRLKVVVAEIEEASRDSYNQFGLDGDVSRFENSKVILERCFKE
jgi:hypothetical protein